MTGQAKRRQRLNSPYEGLTLKDELQKRMTDIVQISQMVVDSKMASWQVLAMPNGEKIIALVLPSRHWEVSNGTVVFK